MCFSKPFSCKACTGILMRVKKTLMYFRKNTADNLTCNVNLVNRYLDAVVHKLD